MSITMCDVSGGGWVGGGEMVGVWGVRGGVCGGERGWAGVRWWVGGLDRPNRY